MSAKLSNKTMGILAGIASALCVCGYVTVNKYVYTHYAISALDYSLFFAFIGGVFGFLSLLKQMNKSSIRELRTNIRSLILLSCAGFLAVGIFVFGQQYTTSVNAAILMTSTIVATSLFSYFLLGDRLRKAQWLWIAILFAGLYISIVGLSGLTLQQGDLIILGSVLLFGFGNAFSRVVMKRMKKPGLVPDTRLTIAGLIALIIGLLFVRDYNLLIVILPWAALAGLFYWLCMKSFAKAVHLLNANEAIVLNNSQIFFTSIAGVLLLSEGYGVEKLIGAIIIIVSVYFITIHKKKTAIINT
jgi:drug/metabolite transporter (DMT)-like permease